MAAKPKNRWRMGHEDVNWYWTGGRNVTVRAVHEPTRISIERSTNLDEAHFTKERLRVASAKLQRQVLLDLQRKVAAHLRSRS